VFVNEPISRRAESLPQHSLSLGGSTVFESSAKATSQGSRRKDQVLYQRLVHKQDCPREAKQHQVCPSGRQSRRQAGTDLCRSFIDRSKNPPRNPPSQKTFEDVPRTAHHSVPPPSSSWEYRNQRCVCVCVCVSRCHASPPIRCI
jgi:hypothetical protein